MNGLELELLVKGFIRPVSAKGYVLITTTTEDGVTVTAKGNQMSYTLPTRMKVKVKVGYVDAGGNPATVDGPVVWNTSDAQTVRVSTVNAADTSEAVIEAVGPLGAAQITATADADLGDGVRELITMLDVSVVAGEAVAGTISPVGSPEPA